MVENDGVLIRMGNEFKNSTTATSTCPICGGKGTDDNDHRCTFCGGRGTAHNKYEEKDTT